MTNKKKPYLPKVRTSYSPKQSEIKSFAPNGDSTPLANPAVDPIVVNNIAWQEFDYTENPLDEGTNILPTKEDDDWD
ncbi:hypothetical protein NNC19_13405 [Clostridium sp. SHJSY1]|uniref:hypothetical protein n=1 Tax=Clostridium sp. SHJSY1 TaxID=2942483 RepID=UPI002875EC58|nr:hypothetical protein [Clostridium sp. SHJSY1]MDS0526683.1 hypothetical protein [Clostridium sp. SHJSY1]